MPTKRPDQLPEGEDFDFEDILMVEKDPGSDSRKLYKASLREFMESALEMDPKRIGNNAILGLQSKFEWLVSQMEKLVEAPVLNDLVKYDSFESETKDKEISYIPPSPSLTPSITPTPTVTPGLPQPSPSPTPTPTATLPAQERIIDVTFNGPLASLIELPDQYKPFQFGFSNWEIIDGGFDQHLYHQYESPKPVSFSPSTLNEELFEVSRSTGDNLKLIVMKYVDFFDWFTQETLRIEDDVSGLVSSSSLTIRIRLY